MIRDVNTLQRVREQDENDEHHYDDCAVEWRSLVATSVTHGKQLNEQR
jgi:hypothetical protein